MVLEESCCMQQKSFYKNGKACAKVDVRLSENLEIGIGVYRAWSAAMVLFEPHKKGPTEFLNVQSIVGLYKQNRRERLKCI